MWCGQLINSVVIRFTPVKEFIYTNRKSITDYSNQAVTHAGKAKEKETAMQLIKPHGALGKYPLIPPPPPPLSQWACSN